MKTWWSLSELAAAGLPGLPKSKQGVYRICTRDGWNGKRDAQGVPLNRRRPGKGGGWEYHVSLLPLRARDALRTRDVRARLALAAAEPATGEGPLWEEFAARPESIRAEAWRRLRAIEAFEGLLAAGFSMEEATARVVREIGVSRATLYNWRRRLHGEDPANYLPLLAPGWVGKTKRSEVSSEAWAAFKADYLRLEEPSASSCYDRVKSAGAAQGWVVPSLKSLTRRLDHEVPEHLQVYLRKGRKALTRMYPAQTRSRAEFHALEGVNADGHTLDVWVKWEDGEVLRPVATVVQDLYSNKIVGWRIDKSESATAVRLAFLDVFRDWGIPDFATLDNGRAFASKQMTGGQKTRFRFSVKPGETEGVLTALGVKVHWATPYSGQSKPIERAFRDFCDRIAKHPRLAGAYSGNSSAAKPDYEGGPKPAAFETFMEVFADGIAEHNAREGRRTEVAQGRSFDAVFAESYATSPIRKATAEQLRLAMLAAASVTARIPDGAVHVLGNRYWAEFLSVQIGARLTVRFDPEDLYEAVAVYGADGAYLGDAACWSAVGFQSVEDARAWRKRRAWLRAAWDLAEAERSMTADQLAALQARPAVPAAPQSKVVRMLRPRSGAAVAEAVEVREFDELDVARRVSAGLTLLIQQRENE